jgi:hypothetical protein
MRERYTAASNEALIALAIRFQWIEIAIDIHQDECGAGSPPTKSLTDAGCPPRYNVTT